MTDDDSGFDDAMDAEREWQHKKRMQRQLSAFLNMHPNDPDRPDDPREQRDGESGPRQLPAWRDASANRRVA